MKNQNIKLFLWISVSFILSYGLIPYDILTSNDKPVQKEKLTFLNLCAPTAPDLNTEPGYDGSLVPLFDGLDVFHYPISSLDDKAQKYFDQGLILSYGFNHGEAARSFREVIRLNPDSPMGYWGLAYVLGPNYNAPMFPDVLGAAHESIMNARLKANNATVKEKMLIEAISKRYPKSLDDDPMPFYQAYAESMKEARAKFPDDMDIAAMTAESLMDLHPWDLWMEDGSPKEWTSEIKSMIESILEKENDHPQAMHLYIHLMEASSEPDLALPAAHGLRSRVPGAGHLVHMPSHIYINTGMYHEGTIANENAVNIDSHYMEHCVEAGVYPLALVPHNWHFLAACTGLEGAHEKALFASRYMAEKTVAQDLMYDPEWGTLQHYYSIPWFILVKFSMWDEILNEPLPDSELIYPTAISAYARAMAFLHTGNRAAALQELSVLEKAILNPSIAENTIWDSNKMIDILTIAQTITKGYIAFQDGKPKNADKQFKRAVEIEDGLNYQEPPDWFFSVRHHYGHFLLQEKKFSEAEDLYREDLMHFPKNGYALKGLQLALEHQGKKEEAIQTEMDFNVAWQWATVELNSSVVE